MASNYTKEDIFNHLKSVLVDDFEVDDALISDDANLFEKLDFDSIDAVDLAVRLQQFTNKKISPEEFKQIRTVGDVVNAVYDLMQD